MRLLVDSRRADQLATLTEEALQSNDRQAEGLARELLDVVQILYGPAHVEVAIAMCYLAVALEEKGSVDQTLELRKRARNIFLSHQRWLN